MAHEKCGIYTIECLPTGKIYVGSSVHIYVRWSNHRARLRRGSHTGVPLQRAWSRHGEAAFRFSILEECAKADLAAREQHYINQLAPALNCMRIIFPRKHPSPEAKAKAAAASRAKAALRTHCPHGHLYDEANTYYGDKGERICRACNKVRVRSIYAAETPEQRAIRTAKMAERYRCEGEEARAKRAAYAAARKDEKSAYDRARRDITRQQKRELVAKMSPEQREALKQRKRESWARCGVDWKARMTDERREEIRQQNRESKARRRAALMPARAIAIEKIEV